MVVVLLLPPQTAIISTDMAIGASAAGLAHRKSYSSGSRTVQERKTQRPPIPSRQFRFNYLTGPTADPIATIADVRSSAAIAQGASSFPSEACTLGRLDDECRIGRALPPMFRAVSVPGSLLHPLAERERD